MNGLWVGGQVRDPLLSVSHAGSWEVADIGTLVTCSTTAWSASAKWRFCSPSGSSRRPTVSASRPLPTTEPVSRGSQTPRITRLASKNRTHFSFSDASRYKALDRAGDQVRVIRLGGQTDRCYGRSGCGKGPGHCVLRRTPCRRRHLMTRRRTSAESVNAMLDNLGQAPGRCR